MSAAIFNGYGVKILKRVLRFKDSDGEVEATPGNNVQINDVDGSTIIRKKSTQRFIEDFKDNLAQNVTTTTGLANSIASFTGGAFDGGFRELGYSSAGGDTGGTIDFESIPVNGLIDRNLLGLHLRYSYSGDPEDWSRVVQESPDNITFTDIDDSAFLDGKLNTTFINKKLFNLDPASTHYRLRLKCETANVSKDLRVQQYEVITDPMPTAEFVQSETVTHSGYASKNGGNFWKYSDEVVNDTGSFITVTDVDHTRYTFNNAVPFVAMYSESNFSGSLRMRLYDKNDTIILQSEEDITENRGSGGITSKANPGDYLVMYSTGTGPASSTSVWFSVTATKSQSNTVWVGATPNNTETNTLGSSVSVLTDSVADLLHNMTIGSEYELRFSGTNSSSTASANIYVYDGATHASGVELLKFENESGAPIPASGSRRFIATSTTLRVRVDANVTLSAGAFLQITNTSDIVYAIPEQFAVLKHINTEQKTGDKWIDGRDIYTRSFDLSLVIAASTPTLVQSISTGLEPLDMYGMVKDSASNRWFKISTNGASGSIGYSFYDDVTGGITMQFGSLATNRQVFTIKYLKP